MPIIDFHTHIFPDDLAKRALESLRHDAPVMHNHTNGTLGGLKDSMKKNGIDLSVTLPVATKPSQVATINDNCSTLHCDSIVPFGTLHPGLSPEHIEAEIAKLKKINIRGIKLHPEQQQFYLDNDRYFPMYEIIQESGLIVVFHAGKEPGLFSCDHSMPASFKKVIGQFPDLKIIAAHMGGWLVWDDVEKILVGEKVFFDTAAITGLMPPEIFVRFVQKHGSDRILFGSDSPWFDQGKSWEWIDRQALTDHEKENIFFNNARHLLSVYPPV